MQNENQLKEIMVQFKALTDATPDTTVFCILRNKGDQIAYIHGCGKDLSLVLSIAVFDVPNLCEVFKAAIEAVDYVNEQIKAESN